MPKVKKTNTNKGKKGIGKGKRPAGNKKESGGEKKDNWQGGLRKSTLFSNKLKQH